MDEHRVGLHSTVRRVWAPTGRALSASVQMVYHWLYLFAWVRPTTGDTFWLLLPTVSLEVMALAWREFAAAVGASVTHPIWVVWDQAGWHGAVPEDLAPGFRVFFLPSHSPELQPAERLWQFIDEPVVNKAFSSMTDLENVLEERARYLMAHPETLQATTCFHWWPKAA